MASLSLTRAQESASSYGGCPIDEYYGGLLTSRADGTATVREDVSRQDLEALLEETTRQVLPYTGSNDRDDVWKALIDVDAGQEPDTVRLLYRQVDFPALPHGTASTWNREHLWPKSRGVEYSGSDFTDVHHLFPADWNVNSARSNLFFGSCGLVEPQSSCKSPAHTEAASDTESDSQVFLPPANVRGDIARALFYMDLRYSSSTNNGIDLVLTDCPSPNNDNEMAYLSQLLTWHVMDPVDEGEKQRNQRVCERWQGNRNPFVDFPELAERFLGSPQTPANDGTGYPSCQQQQPQPQHPSGGDTNNNNEPSSSNDDPCNELSAGDILFVGMRSDNPDLVAMVTFKDLPVGLRLYLTDNAWTGSDLGTNEGTIQLIVTSEIASGAVFGYGGASGEDTLLYQGDWENVQGQFALSASGDSVLLYCKTNTEQDEIRFLAGLENSGDGWVESSNQENDFGSSRSALPAALEEKGTVSLPHYDDFAYVGAQEGSVEQLQDLLTDPSQWSGHNNDEDDMVLPTSFEISLAPVSMTESVAGDVMVVAVTAIDPDMVALVALEPLPGGTELYITDNTWTGSKFLTNEGTLKLTLPPAGVDVGSIFGYGATSLRFHDQWQSEGGRFALAESGDSIVVYTRDGNATKHMAAFSYAGGGWRAPGLADDQYGTADSVLPKELEQVGAVSLPRFESYVYKGPTDGEKEFLQRQLQNTSNWQGYDSSRVEPPREDFSVQSSQSSPSSATSTCPLSRRQITNVLMVGVAVVRLLGWS
ncbi:Endonuclease I [Seminavis robusta]|uniref:Endonuclease I n=1 Tax=Seminavis robusta TaxID=568900 RepID=A0A9N8DTS7_9STRA|nr:Endonuclease I [Seminavis robusta]|eukprot:Sro351_g123920.1 Endonuclease I (762) ;mRNA; f:29684-31969